MSYLYHITYLFNIESIGRDGLWLGSGTTFSAGWKGYSTGKIFLTHADGVSFWSDKLREMAEANTDTPEDGWIPMTLRVSRAALPKSLFADIAGARDSSADAYYVKEKIDSEYLEVWTGAEWEDVESMDSERVDGLLEEVLGASEEVFEDDSHWWEIDYEYFVPSPDELTEIV